MHRRFRHLNMNHFAALAAKVRTTRAAWLFCLITFLLNEIDLHRLVIKCCCSDFVCSEKFQTDNSEQTLWARCMKSSASSTHAFNLFMNESKVFCRAVAIRSRAMNLLWSSIITWPKWWGTSTSNQWKFFSLGTFVRSSRCNGSHCDTFLFFASISSNQSALYCLFQGL